MDGNPPWGGQGTPTPPSGAQPPVPTDTGPPPPPPWPPQPGTKQQHRGLLVPIGVGVAVLLAAAALAVALVNGNGKASPAPGPTQSANPGPSEVLVDDADRSLCLAIAPLMIESQDTRKTFQAVGPQNSPERKFSIPKFERDTNDWARRIQQVLNDNAEPPRYLTRVLQRYIDDMTIYVVTLSPVRDSSSYETPIYDLTIMDFSGIMGRCLDVDAPWWN